MQYKKGREIFSVWALYIRKSRLFYSSIPTISFYKTTYRGAISSCSTRIEKKKNIIQYIEEL